MVPDDRRDRDGPGLGGAPRRIGPYRLERLLGRGGMGEVYAARDERLDRWVALKRVLEGSEDPRRRRRLRREARLVAQLNHPAVVQVFDLVEDGEWVVLELVEGPTLRRVLEGGPLELGRAVEYGRQIAGGLAAAHGLGIVHRDLKTENVVVLPDGRVKVLDFGLAKRLPPPEGGQRRGAGEEGSLTAAGKVMGTGRAMSPEQARGLEVGPASDLFSLGVLLYEMLTGVSPFRGKGFYDTLARVATHHPRPVRELLEGELPEGEIPKGGVAKGEVPKEGRGRVLAELSALVDRLLAKVPELRPAGAREVAATLERLADELRLACRTGPAAGREPEGTVTAGFEGPGQGPDQGPEQERLEGPSPARGRAGDRPGDHAPPGPSFLPMSVPRPKLLALMVVGVAVGVLGLSLVLPRWIGSETGSGSGSGPGAPAERAEISAGTSDEAPAAGLPLSHELPSHEGGMAAARRPDRPGSIERAVEVFQRRLAADPASAAAHAGLARAYWEKARTASAGADPHFLEQAGAAAREAVRLDPRLAEARISLGLVELQQGHPEEARRQLDTALELDPAAAGAHFGLAKLAESRGRPEEAEERYRRALEIAPASLYFDALGGLLYGAGRYAEAEEAFRSSLELAPDDLHALRSLGALYYVQGDADQAAEIFRRALEVRPDASLSSNLGTVLFSQGLYPRAAEAFEDALATGGASHKPVYWLNLADTYRQMPGREEDAGRAYRRALQLLGEKVEAAPEDVRWRSRRALALARSGAKEAAQEDLRRLRELGTEADVYSLLRRAVAEELVGERGAALGTLERALASGLALGEVRREPDLVELRADPRFHFLVMELGEGAGETEEGEGSRAGS